MKKKRIHTFAKAAKVTSVGCSRDFLKMVQYACQNAGRSVAREFLPRELLDVFLGLQYLMEDIASAIAKNNGYQIQVTFNRGPLNAERRIQYVNPDGRSSDTRQAEENDFSI